MKLELIFLLIVITINGFCPPHSQHLDGMDCVCDPGYYATSNSLGGLINCTKCKFPCKECLNDHDCLSCLEGDQILDSHRTDKTVNFRCPCIPGYYDKNQKCEECDSICLTCFTQSECEFCKTDLNLNYVAVNGVCECQDGYYSVGPGDCVKCKDGCLKCTNGLDCCLCDKNYYGTNCNQKCQPDEFYDGSSCKKCQKKCQECQDSAGKCTVCPQQMNRVDMSVTLQDCPCKVGYYENNATCDQCNVACLHCTKSKEHCDLCQPFSNRGPLPQCECLTGYFQQKNEPICQKCDDSCEECTENKTTCLKCRYGYDNSILDKMSSSTQYPCSLIDRGCAFDQYQSFTICQQCFENGSAKCSSCYQKQLDNSNQFKKFCIHCSTLNTFPPDCSYESISGSTKGYYKCDDKENICQLKCSSNPDFCSNCDSQSQQCLQCQQSYQLTFQEGKNQCALPNLKENTLINYTQKTLFQFNYLSPCPQSCSKCNFSQCQECLRGYIQKGTNCVSSCSQGFLPSMNQCLPCPLGCQQCYHQYVYHASIYNFQPICQACDSGYELVLGYCQKLDICDSNLKQYKTPLMAPQAYYCITNQCSSFVPLLNQQSICLDCIEGYYLINHKCDSITLTDCSINCEECVIQYKSGWYQYECIRCKELYEIQDGRFCFESSFLKNQNENVKCQKGEIQIPIGVDKTAQCLECPLGCVKCEFEYFATESFMYEIAYNRKLLCLDKELVIDYKQIDGVPCEAYDIGCIECYLDEIGIFQCIKCLDHYELHVTGLCILKQGENQSCRLQTAKNSMVITSQMIGLQFCHLLQDDCFESKVKLINQLDVEECLYCILNEMPEYDEKENIQRLNCPKICPLYFYENQQICFECGVGLSDCYQDQMLQIQAKQCLPGYELRNEICTLKKSASIVMYNDYTLQNNGCPPQTFLIEGVCYNCPLYCYECTGPYYQHCTKCIKGYYKNQYDICDTCSLGCMICLDDSKCIRCQNGFKSVNRFGYLECLKILDSYNYAVIESYLILNLIYLSKYYKVPKEQIFQTIQHYDYAVREDGEYLSSFGWKTGSAHQILTNLSMVYHEPMIGDKCYFPFVYFAQTCVISCPSSFYSYINQFQRMFCYPKPKSVKANHNPQLLFDINLKAFEEKKCKPQLAKSYRFNTCIRCSLKKDDKCVENIQIYNYSFYRRNQKYISDPFHAHNLAFNLHLHSPVNTENSWNLIKVIKDVVGEKEYLFHPSRQMRIVTQFYNNLNLRKQTLTIPFINLQPNCYYYLEYDTYPVIIWTHNEGTTLSLIENHFFNFSLSDFQLITYETPYFLYLNTLKFYNMLNSGYLIVENEKKWTLIYPITRPFQSFMVKTPDFCQNGNISFKIVLKMMNQEIYEHTIKSLIKNWKNKLSAFYELINHPILVKQETIRPFEFLEYSALLSEVIDQQSKVDWSVMSRFDCEKDSIEQCSSQGQCLQNQFLTKCSCYNDRQGFRCQYSKRQFLEIKQQMYYLINKLSQVSDLSQNYLSYMHVLKVFTQSDVMDITDTQNQVYIYKKIAELMQFNSVILEDQIEQKDELDVYMDVLNNLIRLLDYNIDTTLKLKVRPLIENEILYQIQYVGLYAFKLMPPSFGYVDYKNSVISMKMVKLYTKEITENITSIKMNLLCNLGQDFRIDQDQYIDFVEIEIPNIEQLLPKNEDIILFKIALVRSFFLKNKLEKDLFIPQLVYIQAYDYHNMQKILTNYSDQNGTFADRIKIKMKLATNIELKKHVLEKQCYLYYQSQVDQGIWLPPLNCIYRSFENEEITCECINYGFVGVFDQDFVKDIESIVVKEEKQEDVQKEGQIYMVPIFENKTQTEDTKNQLVPSSGVVILLLLLLIH